ncbi:MAG: tyrosine-type recombinase/integrase [Rhodobacterales bacterium]|nr:tyrosine-type recombinase/integrase [Rhodobacterales bacterium]
MRTATKRLADGSVVYYAYAYQGGPLIAKGTGKTTTAARADLDAKLAEQETLAKLTAARDVQEIKPAPSIAYIEGLVRAFLNSPEFGKLKPRTQRDYRHYLDDFRVEFGDWRTALFEDPRTAQDLADWRDEAPGARTGDFRMSVVSRLFSWARARGITSARPTEALERVYSADRSDRIWSEEEVGKLLAVCNGPLSWAVRLAINTGLRQGDLITLPWSAVSDLSIRYRTSKRGKDAIIPITPALRELLAEIPRRSPVILTSSTGRAWTGDGLRSSFNRSKTEAGIEGLTWHDFRGTAVTRLAKTKLTTRDIARIIGWSEARIEQIMTRYVSADALAADMLLRMAGERILQTGCKPDEIAND